MKVKARLRFGTCWLLNELRLTWISSRKCHRVSIPVLSVMIWKRFSDLWFVGITYRTLLRMNATGILSIQWLGCPVMLYFIFVHCRCKSLINSLLNCRSVLLLYYYYAFHFNGTSICFQSQFLVELVTASTGRDIEVLFGAHIDWVLSLLKGPNSIA